MSSPAELAASGEDYDIEKAWNEAVKSFLKTTKGEFDPTKPPKVSPQQVLDQIAARQSKDEEKASKFATAKDVIGKSLKCVQLLGGIAAQAASTVYPGTSLCYNALTYLISAGQNYNKIFASLTDLFSRISDVLDRFAVYHEMDAQSKSNIDLPLKKIITQLLLSFMRICELSIKVLNENRFKKMLKVIAFNDDEGISAEVVALERLTANESQMRGTLTYKSVRNTETVTKNIETSTRNIETATAAQTETMKLVTKGMENVEKSQRQQETESAFQKQKNRLEKVFGKENKSEAVFRQYRDTRVPNTGAWLLTDPLFRKWADPEHIAAPFLFVSGREGFGKSFLCANTVVNLQERFPPSTVDHTAGRVLIGHAFLQRGSKDAKPVAEALKSLVLQFSNDEVFVKEFSGIVGEQELDGGNDDQVIDLFGKLVDSLTKVTSTTFIIFDGVDDIDDGRTLGKNALLLWRLLQNMQNGANASEAEPVEEPQVNGTTPEPVAKKQKKPPKVRVLITGSPRAQEQFVTARIFETIDLTGSNSQDVESWVSDRLASMPNLQAATSSGDDVKSRVLEALLNVTSGDFKYIDLLLKEIGSKERASEIDKVLDRVRVGETRKEMISLEVSNLNESLATSDIKDLNELLLWILANLDYLMISELEAALYLKNGEANFSPLTDRIKAKFSSLLSVEPAENEQYATVALQSETHRDYFNEASQARANSHQNNSTVVNDSEVKIVKRFLRSVCDDELFQKFGFEEFFQQKLQKDEDAIFVDLESANLQLLERTLRIIGSPDEAFNPLRSYSIDYFYGHLERVDLSLSSPELKVVIGPLLVQVLTDQDTIERWWGQNHQTLRFNILFDVDDEFINCAISWLKDSAVLKDLSEEQRAWAKSVTANVKSPVVVLEHAATFWTLQWLRGDWGDNDMTHFICLHTYIAKLNFAEHQEPVTEDPGALPLDHIQETWKWALARLEIDGNEYKTRHNLGRTLRFYSHIIEAIDEFKEAIALTDDNWMAHWDVAISYEMLEDYQAALDYSAENWEVLTKGGEEAGYLYAVLLCRARWNVSAGNLDLGVSQMFEILNQYNTPWHVCNLSMRIVQVHKDQNAVSSIIELLQDLDNRHNEEYDCPATVFAYALNYNSDIFHEAILDASKRTNSPVLIEAQYSKALDVVRSTPFKKEYKGQHDVAAIEAVLQYYHASLCYDAGEEDRAIDLWQELALSQNAENAYHLTVQTKSRKRLSSLYLTRLRALKDDDEEAPQKKAHYEELFEIILETGVDLFDPRLILARYYLKCGENVEKARELVKPRIKIALDLLDDDDPSNDWQGFQQLATVFNHMDEDENSLAAWSLMTPPYIYPAGQQEEQEEEAADGEEEGETGEEEPEVNGVSEDAPEVNGTSEPEEAAAENDTEAAPEAAADADNEAADADGEGEEEEAEEETPQQRVTIDDQGVLSYGCDGDACEVCWTWATDMRHCRDCLDVLFCADHHTKLKESGSRYVTCDPSHDFLIVPAYNAELIEQYAPDRVKVGERVLTIKDWLDEIRRDWGFEETSSEEETNSEGSGNEETAEEQA